MKKDAKLLGLPASAKDEESARAFLEEMRWPDGPVCPHCEFDQVYRLNPKQGSKTRKGLLKCKKCRKQFTVTVGTIFEDSHIPLHKWLMAIHFLCSSKKGMSAHQLHRLLGITYKSAWFMAHRLRHAMKQPPFAEKLKGVVEADETYVGGKGHYFYGRSPKKKTPVLVLVERKGEARSKPVKNVSAKELGTEILANVDPSSTMMTDDWKSYKKVGKLFKGGHKVIRHSLGHYAKGDIYTNTAESYFALLKRGINGTFHHVSKQHLGKYCDEFSFRWNSRKLSDNDRAKMALKGIEGKRLLYKVPINKE